MHRFSARVHYDMTDAGGVVYHANYLTFFMQARVAWMREYGWHIGQLQQQGIMTPVYDAQLRYHKPAFLDDVLVIDSSIERLRRCSITFTQKARREHEQDVLCDARIVVACVNEALKMIPWPAGLWQGLIKESE